MSYQFSRTNAQWEKYRKARNNAARLRSISVRNYFEQKCNAEVKKNPKLFWKAVRPFMTDKKTFSSSQCITLKTEDKIENDPNEVSDILNSYFVNVADHIGNTEPIDNVENIRAIIDRCADHESIQKIKENRICQKEFDFKEVS